VTFGANAYNRAPITPKSSVTAIVRMRRLRGWLLAWAAVQLCLTACAAIPPAIVAPPEPSVPALSPSAREAVDRLVVGAMARHEIPGLSLAIVSDDRIVHVAGHGFARLPDRAAAPDTTYRLASISKTFTAIAALQLAERGALDLDAPVQRYVPAFPAKRWPVTTRQLLGHLGGIRHYRGREALSTAHYTDVVTPLAIFSGDPLQHEPGTRFLYSTYGYSLVGAVVEAAAEQRFADYVRDHVFTPSGMRDAGIDDPTVAAPRLAAGYDVAADGRLRPAPAFDATNKIPGGGFVATAEDMAMFAQAVMTDRLLRPGTRDAMWTSQTTRDGKRTGYGLGWQLGALAGRSTVFHTGGQPGVTTALLLVPGRGCAVVVLTNRGGVGGIGDLARGIAGATCQ